MFQPSSSTRECRDSKRFEQQRRMMLQKGWSAYANTNVEQKYAFHHQKYTPVVHLWSNAAKRDERKKMYGQTDDGVLIIASRFVFCTRDFFYLFILVSCLILTVRGVQSNHMCILWRRLRRRLNEGRYEHIHIHRMWKANEGLWRQHRQHVLRPITCYPLLTWNENCTAVSRLPVVLSTASDKKIGTRKFEHLESGVHANSSTKHAGRHSPREHIFRGIIQPLYCVHAARRMCAPAISDFLCKHSSPFYTYLVAHVSALSHRHRVFRQHWLTRWWRAHTKCCLSH